MDTETAREMLCFDQVASPCGGGGGGPLYEQKVESRQTSFYDYAAELLTELLPGWDDGLEDDYSDVEDGDDDSLQDADERLRTASPVPPPPLAPVNRAAEDAFIVDLSYLACVREAERFLVEREGFSREDAVVTGLREHLQDARDRAVRGVHREAVRIVRPPGCTA